jgi:hypothetical protein
VSANWFSKCWECPSKFLDCSVVNIDFSFPTNLVFCIKMPRLAETPGSYCFTNTVLDMIRVNQPATSATLLAKELWLIVLPDTGLSGCGIMTLIWMMRIALVDPQRLMMSCWWNWLKTSRSLNFIPWKHSYYMFVKLIHSYFVNRQIKMINSWSQKKLFKT